MKYIFLLCIFAMLSITTSAQSFYLGDSKELISKAMIEVGHSFSYQDSTDDKSLFFQVYEKSKSTYGDSQYIFYFGEDNKCRQVVEAFSSRIVLIYVISELNKKYIKSSDSVWVSKNYTFSVTLKTGETGFNVSYRLL